jgi:cell division cycle 20-like protein 1, cofactor of APC complex
MDRNIQQRPTQSIEIERIGNTSGTLLDLWTSSAHLHGLPPGATTSVRGQSGTSGTLLPQNQLLAWVSGASPSTQRLHGQLLQRELLNTESQNDVFGNENDRLGGGFINGTFLAPDSIPLDDDFGDINEEETFATVSGNKTISSAAVTAAALARAVASRRLQSQASSSSVQLSLLSRSDAPCEAERGVSSPLPNTSIPSQPVGKNATMEQLDSAFAEAGGRPFARQPSTPTRASKNRLLNFGGSAEASYSSSSDPRQRQRAIASPFSENPTEEGVFLPSGRLIVSDNATMRRSLEEIRSMSLASLKSPTQALLESPQRIGKRQVAKVPYKVLDAPQLADDFYLNLLDWSAQNILVVGLGPDVYTWNAYTASIVKLPLVGPAPGATPPENNVTSVSWSNKGNHVAVGSDSGRVEIWDINESKLVRTLSGHTARVGSLSWASSTLASGSRDKSVLIRDLRSPKDCEFKLTSHKQEVCGLRFSLDWSQLASGGNDNKLFLWSLSMMRSTKDSKESQPQVPLMKFVQHTAAIKALAWSPHRANLLASGGGTSDKCIRFLNTNTGVMEQVEDTGAQICQLEWSQDAPELVSAHGYSTNSVVVWQYPSMKKVATLSGHTTRVLYMALSPDGQSIVTGAGDETLRFWHVFARNQKKNDIPLEERYPIGTGSWLLADGAMAVKDSPKPLLAKPSPSLLLQGLSKCDVR